MMIPLPAVIEVLSCRAGRSWRAANGPIVRSDRPRGHPRLARILGAGNYGNPIELAESRTRAPQRFEVATARSRSSLDALDRCMGPLKWT